MPREKYNLVKTVCRPDLLSSKRDMELCVVNKRWDFMLQPLLTVEFYVKWYELFLISPSKKEPKFLDIESIHFGFLSDIAPEGITPFVDHVPNPLVVRLFARQNGYEIDELANDLIRGRWHNEVVDDVIMECPRCEGTGVIPLPNDPSGVLPRACRACRGLGETRTGG